MCFHYFSHFNGVEISHVNSVGSHYYKESYGSPTLRLKSQITDYASFTTVILSLSPVLPAKLRSGGGQ